MTFWCGTIQQAAYRRAVVLIHAKAGIPQQLDPFYQGTQRNWNCWHTTSKEFLSSSCFWECKIGCIPPKKSYKGGTLCKEDVILGIQRLKAHETLCFPDLLEITDSVSNARNNLWKWDVTELVFTPAMWKSYTEKQSPFQNLNWASSSSFKSEVSYTMW